MFIKYLGSTGAASGTPLLKRSWYISGVCILFGLLCIGIYSDLYPSILMPYLIPVFYGIAFMVTVHMQYALRKKSILTYSGLFLFSFRISFFPALVIAGYFASLMNSILWLSLDIEAPHTFFFPLLYLVMMVFSAFLLLSLSSGMKRLIGLGAIVMCCMISFTSFHDLHLVDPLLYSIKEEGRGTECDDRKNYYEELLQESSGISSSFLLLNAAITYELIPPSPWGREVRDRLACLAYQNPEGSSRDRLEEHFRVFMTMTPNVQGSLHE